MTIVADHEEKAVVPVEVSVVRPLQTAEEAAADFREYQRLTSAILDESDYKDIKGDRFKKKSAWRKYAKAFNLSDEIVESTIVRRHDEKACEILHNPDKLRGSECSCATTYARYRVRCIAPNGRVTEGVGVCSTREQRGFSKPEHDIPATAHTRAKNRAISDMIGAGEVSAEESTSDVADEAPAGKAVGDEDRALIEDARKHFQDDKAKSDAVMKFMRERHYRNWADFYARGADDVEHLVNLYGMESNFK